MVSHQSAEWRLNPAHSQTKWEVFHAQMGGGKTIPLLKTMLTSVCVNDCNYCVFRDKRDFPRYSFTPDEMASVFMQMVRKGWCGEFSYRQESQGQG